MSFKESIGSFSSGLGTGLADFASPLSGLFGQDLQPSTQKLILPNSPIIKDYNMGKNLFKVRLTSKSWEPDQLDAKGNKTTSKDNETKKFQMEVLYNQPSLSVSHGFDWSNSFLGGVAEGISTANKFVQRGSKAFSSGNAFEGMKEGVGGLDVAPIYKGSTKPSFTFNFILLAHTDPFKEVVLPAQLLTYLAYPSIVKSNRDKLIQLLNGHASQFPDEAKSKGLNDLSNALGGVGSENKTVQAGIKKAQDAIKSLGDTFGNDGGNNWRYLTGSMPDFWEVETSSGIMNLKYCHISNLNITYHAPWVAPIASFEGKYAKSLQFANSIKSIVDSGAQGGESGIQSMVNSIFPNVLDYGASAVSKLGSSIPGSAGEFLKDFSGEVDYGFKGGYPSYAEVSITLTSNYEKMFGEDWLADSRPDPVTVSKGQAAGAIFGATNSIIKHVL